jgi:ABC-type iron transport system FetAB permease component
MMLFFIGVIEMIIISTWTKVVTETKVVVSGIVTIVNVLIWYYVLQAVVNDVTNFKLVAMYAIGCAIGTMLSTAFFRLNDAKKSRKQSPRAVANEELAVK